MARTASPRADGDVHVGSIEGDVRPVPGFGTKGGEKLGHKIRAETIERVTKVAMERRGG